MFPVISKLRRSAIKIIYTGSPELQFSGRHSAYDVNKKKWAPANETQMFQAHVSSDRPQERATRLCVFENELFDQAGLENIRYTLVLGPEDEDGASRVFRFLILKGIVMTENNRIKKRRPAGLKNRTRAPLPPGTVVDVR